MEALETSAAPPPATKKHLPHHGQMPSHLKISIDKPLSRPLSR